MLDSDPLWYKDAIIYELHVRAFHDSVGDGMGDFRGLTERLDYLADLGITTIWLLPFYPSPLKDDGYDIASYTDIHPWYGKLRDFQEFLNAAHQRGLRVITELVLNHTSDQHPWFQRARRSPPGSVERDFYVWSNTPERYKEARIIFQDFESSNWSWDPIAKAYYWHRFYSHQPDLNFDNPAVWDAIFPIVDFWFNMGVDGMRLDAVPYLYERENTNCENLPETHAFLKAIRKHVDERFPNRMFLAEANQWPEDAVAYFGNGDECQMCFHFPVMPRMFMAIHMEDRFPILDILNQTPAIPENCQWGLFLRNHDELTLEMVTDEERDYMYRAYANDQRARINLGIRHRLAPLLGNNRRRIELMNGLLFSLPGTPVLYYGDEIGMGDNIYLGDRNGVRTPMQWSADRNAGFSRANPQKLYLPIIIDPEYHYEAINVEAQQNNTNSLLWWMKRLIALRKRYQAFGRGTLEFLQPANRKILAFLRRYKNETILVIANLSRFVQHVELDLSRWQNMVPIEMFGRNAFPRIGKQPYPLSLAPHGFIWFALEPETPGHPGGFSVLSERTVPVLPLPGRWEDYLFNSGHDRVEEILPEFLQRHQWLVGPVRRITAARLGELIPIRIGELTTFFSIVRVEYDQGTPDQFVLPLVFLTGTGAEHVQERTPEAVLARLQGTSDGILVDGLAVREFARAILDVILTGRNITFAKGDVQGTLFSAPLDGETLKDLPATLNREEQTNTSIIFGDRVILKVLRRLEPGIHPEVEVGRYLTERRGAHLVAPVLGKLEYRAAKGDTVTLAVLHELRHHEGTAWQYTLDEMSRYFERVLALPAQEQQAPLPRGSLLDLTNEPIPPVALELINRYLDSARLLGQRTAELHLALAAEKEDPAFVPEPFSQLYQRSLYQSMRNTHRHVLDLLQQRLDALPKPLQEEAQQLLAAEKKLLDRFHIMMEQRFDGIRIRIHGDYNLCEILSTGKDFIIIDFEGEPGRSLRERRLKRSPLRDVVSMIRSFDYAASSSLAGHEHRRGHAPGVIRFEDVALLAPWARFWFQYVAATFLKAYLEHATPGGILPSNRDEMEALLEVFLLEKSLQELGLELDHRPEWVSIPLRGTLRLLQRAGE